MSADNAGVFPRDRAAELWHHGGVTTTEAIQLLEKFRAGGAGRDEVLRAFQTAPVADLGFAQVDTHRALRKGFPEVIFGARQDAGTGGEDRGEIAGTRTAGFGDAHQAGTRAMVEQKIQARGAS